MAGFTNSSCWSTPEVYKHHEQQKICPSRPKYREGRRPKAVKVYTINLESRYLMLQGVPAIGVMTELIELSALYGAVEEYRVLDEYPAEQFTEVYLIKFQKLTSARAAKRHMDEKSFFGGLLHVCYAPEYETVEDTRLKLQDRRRYVNRTTQNKTKEQDHRDEECKKPMSSDTVATTARTSSGDDQRSSDASNKGETSSTSQGHYLGFPLLPLPPQEFLPYRHAPSYDRLYSYQANQCRSIPSEDKMGSLHNAINTKQQLATNISSVPSSSGGDRGIVKRLSKNPPLAAPPRFVPRTTHLENRKRKIVETNKDSLFGFVDKNEILIGPKLPDRPKMDMADESLNITANMIRNTLKKVASVPEVKPTEKKTKSAKPRRRI
ncbi:RNA-binding protein 48 [Oncorhynchus tshawytscha]|uniref:RNA-binding protein 48 n=1 Tax=Oncorhynchus tshawytscha TaxID=74940 RepID=UPI000D09CFB5|nr:RNA-binding protein 48 [Oncorhynchus tshawytscha]